MKKICKLALSIMILSGLFAFSAHAENYYNSSNWSQESIEKANRCGILPLDVYAKDLTKPITRKELVSVLLDAYENATGEEYIAGASHFTDDTSAEVAAIYELGIMNGTSDYEFSPDLSTTREAMAKIIVSFRGAIGDPSLELRDDYTSSFSDFDELSDWAKPYVEIVTSLGILNGYENGTFRGSKTVSWEEAITLILRSVELTELEQPYFVSVPDTNIVSSKKDFYIGLDGEAELYAIKVSDLSEPIALGNSGTIAGGTLDSNSLYYLYAVRDGVLTSPFAVYTDKFNSFVKCDSETDASKITVSWSRLPNDEPYTVKITEQRFSYYEGDIAPKVTTYEFDTENSYTFNKNSNRQYTIEVSSPNGTYEKFSVYSPMGYNDGAAEISATYPTTKEEADVLMVTVTVPVWRLVNGEKVASTADITVHNKIADKIKLVFEEIYNGSEQFPIKDVGAYAWRGGKTEHNGGTAIDINYNENYCIYNNGTTIGECWSPYENPYSITPYGDVVNAFEKYGFTWGGDAWRNPKDYMHFSYLGT